MYTVTYIAYSLQFDTIAAYNVLQHCIYGVHLNLKNNQIYLLQKKAIRLCAGSDFYDHTDPLFYRFRL